MLHGFQAARGHYIAPKGSYIAAKRSYIALKGSYIAAKGCYVAPEGCYTLGISSLELRGSRAGGARLGARAVWLSKLQITIPFQNVNAITITNPKALNHHRFQCHNHNKSYAKDLQNTSSILAKYLKQTCRIPAEYMQGIFETRAK